MLRRSAVSSERHIGSIADSSACTQKVHAHSSLHDQSNSLQAARSLDWTTSTTLGTLWRISIFATAAMASQYRTWRNCRSLSSMCRSHSGNHSVTIKCSNRDIISHFISFSAQSIQGTGKKVSFSTRNHAVYESYPGASHCIGGMVGERRNGKIRL